MFQNMMIVLLRMITRIYTVYTYVSINNVVNIEYTDGLNAHITYIPRIILKLTRWKSVQFFLFLLGRFID